METEWVPANGVERDLAAALEADDSQRYARIVLSAPLFLPVLPEPGSQPHQELERLLPLSHEHVLAFTSPEAMSLVLGDFTRGSRRTGFAELARLWPGEEYRLALNPGLPIGVVLPPDALLRMADGSETLVAADGIQDEVAEQTRIRIRQTCLAELGGEDGRLIDAPPANGTEEELRAAVEAEDPDAFLEALIASNVIVPVAEPADQEGISEPGFPWIEVGLSVPVFSSTAMLARAAPVVEHSVEVPFLLVAANWPSEEHALCFNPGSVTELILSGDGVDEIVEVVAEGQPD